MPQPETYGAQPPLEVLRSLLDGGGFHESKKMQWKKVHQVNLLAACAPPSGGRHLISARLLRNLRFCFHLMIMYIYIYIDIDISYYPDK